MMSALCVCGHQYGWHTIIGCLDGDWCDCDSFDGRYDFRMTTENATTDGWRVELCRPYSPPEFAAKYPGDTNWQWVVFSPDGFGRGGFQTQQEAEVWIQNKGGHLLA